jgi:hypothetical protein
MDDLLPVLTIDVVRGLRHVIQMTGLIAGR